MIDKTSKRTEMKKYMNIYGATFTESEARNYYGDRFETAVLAKVVLDKDGNVIGEWE